MKDVYKFLENLKISYKKYDHPPVYTVKEAEEHIKNIEGANTKNLFLKNEKGNSYYLVILFAEKKINLKNLASQLEEKKLSFASPEKLMKFLGLEPGSVSPFGLINDKDCVVRVVIEDELRKVEKIGFHPNKNTSTIVLTQNNFQKYLENSGNSISYISI